MDLNRGNANLDIFFTEARTEFLEALNAPKENVILNNCAMTVPSKSSQTRHGWLNQIPAMRKWVGDRVVNNIQSNTLTAVNDKFENTIEITREEFEDDEYQLYKPVFGIMGRQAVATQDRQLSDVLFTNGTWGGDGAAIFGTTRKYGVNTISNYVTTAFDSAGVALTTGIKAMSTYLGHNNQPLMARARQLIYTPNMYDLVHKAVKNDFTALATGDATISRVGGDIGNPNKNIVELIMNDYGVDGYVDLDLTTYSNAGKYWFLVGESMGIKAGLIYQTRIMPELQDQRARLDASNAEMFMQDKVQWGVRARSKAFCGLPHLVYGGFATALGS